MKLMSFLWLQRDRIILFFFSFLAGLRLKSIQSLRATIQLLKHLHLSQTQDDNFCLEVLQSDSPKLIYHLSRDFLQPCFFLKLL